MMWTGYAPWLKPKHCGKCGRFCNSPHEMSWNHCLRCEAKRTPAPSPTGDKRKPLLTEEAAQRRYERHLREKDSSAI
jgi:hypothetical protein